MPAHSGREEPLSIPASSTIIGSDEHRRSSFSGVSSHALTIRRLLLNIPPLFTTVIDSPVCTPLSSLLR